MSKKIRPVLIASGLLFGTAALASAASYLTTKYLVDAALDRKEPELMRVAEKQFLGSEVNKDFLEQREANGKKLAAIDMEEVEISADDGIVLVGHWYPCENAKRIVISMHGWRSSWELDFGMIAEFWHNNGCSILFAEQRGQNNSGGEYMSFGLSERFDCRGWINWVNENLSPRIPIYLAGISMGATTVLMTTGMDLPENIHGVMADCGFTSPHEIWKHVSNNNLHIPYSLRAFFADEMFRKKVNMRTNEYSTIDAIKECKIPVLFIHGTNDRFVPVQMTYQNYVACSSEKRLLVVPGADHGMSYFTEKKKYEDTVKDFWKDFDEKQH